MNVKPLTDAEVLASFMEPKPMSIVGRRVYYEGDQDGVSREVYLSARRWWEADTGERIFRPINISLTECHEVEARLTDEQWDAYRCWFMVGHEIDGHSVPFGTYLLHADAGQKTRALAAVLRPLVEGAGDAQKEQKNA